MREDDEYRLRFIPDKKKREKLTPKNLEKWIDDDEL